MYLTDKNIPNIVTATVHNPPPPDFEERIRDEVITWEDATAREQTAFEQMVADVSQDSDVPDEGMSIQKIADLVTSIPGHLDRYVFSITDNNNRRWIVFYTTEDIADPNWKDYSGVVGHMVLDEGPHASRVTFISPRYMYPNRLTRLAIRLCLFEVMYEAFLQYYVAWPRYCKEQTITPNKDVVGKDLE
jgi:hypothetical protein